MSKIIDFERRDLLQKIRGTDDIQYERFLLDEGLELLAHYRLIADSDVREAIRNLVARISQTHREKAERSNPM